MANNEGKWKVYQNAVGLDGPPGVRQNLNEDLQENLGNDLDHALRRHQGSCVASGWAVTAGAGLSVAVATGVGFVDGQLVGGSGSVASLPASTTGIKIYVEAGTPWGNPASQWPAVFGQTTGALASTRLLLALVNTGPATIGAIQDQRIYTEPVSTIVGSIDDTVGPAAAATSIRHRFGMLARRLMDIIGGSSWLDAIPISLTAVLAKFHQTTGHKHTGVAGDGPQINPVTALGYVPLNKAGDAMSGGYLTLANDPTAYGHAATKGYADTKLGTAGGSISGPLYINPPLHPNSGGTGLNWFNPGDILFASGNQTWATRAAGAQGMALIMSGGVPVWGTISFPPAPIRWTIQGVLGGPFARISSAYMERTVYFKRIIAWSDIVPTGWPIVLNFKVNGTPIFSVNNRVHIWPGTQAGQSAAFDYYPYAAEGWRLTMDIDQAAQNGGGGDLIVTVEFQ